MKKQIFFYSRVFSLLLSLLLAAGLLLSVGLGTGAAEGDGAPGDPWRWVGVPVLSPTLRVDVRALALDPVSPTLLYAAADVAGTTGTRVHRSVDGGLTWTPVYTGGQLNALTVYGPRLYAGGVGSYEETVIVKSADGGESWTPAFAGPEGYQSLRALAIDPLTPTTAYAAGGAWGAFTGGTVYRSLDDGATWTRVFSLPAGSGSADLLALAVNPMTPSVVFAGGYVDDGSTHYAVLYRTADGGVTWSQVYSESDPGGAQQFTSLVVHPLTPTLVYAGSQAHKYVYRSMDGGLTWTKVFTDSGFRLALDPPGTVYTADDWRELHQSTASGDVGSWSKVGANTPGDIRAFVLEPESGVLTLGFQELGVYRSDDGGVTWSEHNAGIKPLAPLRDLGVVSPAPGRLLAAAGCDGGWVSEDGGQTWLRLPLTACVATLAAHPAFPHVIYAGTATDSGALLLRSTDGGVSFTPVYTPAFVVPDGSGGSASIEVIAAAPSVSSTLYAAGQAAPAGADPYGVVLWSENGGVDWSPVFTLPHGSLTALAVHPLEAATAYAGGEVCSGGPCVGALYRTEDRGGHWVPVYTTSTAVRSVVIDPQNPAVLYVAEESGAVAKSVDGGTTWQTVRAAGAGDAYLTMDSRVPSHLYLAERAYVGESPDGGRTWSPWSAPINQGTAGLIPVALPGPQGAVTQTFYAASARGVWTYVRPAPQPGAPMTVTLQSEALTAAVGSTLTIRALVQDLHENWAADGTVVTFTADMTGLFPATPFTRTLAGGTAEAVLTAARPGRAAVTVTVGSASARLALTFGEILYLPLVVQSPF